MEKRPKQTESVVGVDEVTTTSATNNCTNTTATTSSSTCTSSTTTHVTTAPSSTIGRSIIFHYISINVFLAVSVPSNECVADDSTTSHSQLSSNSVSQVTHTSQEPPHNIAQNKGEAPRQPTGIQFPSRPFGRTKRSFQASWYNEYEWLEYSIERDAAFCFPCRFFGVARNPALIYTCFRDWKNARGKVGILTAHGNSCSRHHDAVLSWNQYRSTFVNHSSVAVHIE